MAVNSWLHLSGEDPRQRLPDDLRQQDARQARDCGWVDQMRPFIASHATTDGWIVDPFCGFASTLLAAQETGVRAAGVELDAQRVELARTRLARAGAPAADYPVLAGSLAQPEIRAALRQPAALGEALGAPGGTAGGGAGEQTGKIAGGEGALAAARRFTLCLTNIPYFGCRDGEAVPGQLYAADCYEPYLQGLRDVFFGVHDLLEPGGWCIVMAQNLSLGGRFVPLAWDVARLLGERFVLHEERVLLYDRPADAAVTATGPGNRAHEYALICRKASSGLDVQQGRALLQRMQAAGFEFAVYGSFLRCLRGESEVPPNDIDLLLAGDEARLSGLLRWLEEEGFRLESWNAPVHPPVSLPFLAQRHYFRARRIDRHGGFLQVDIALAESREALEGLREAVGLSGGRDL